MSCPRNIARVLLVVLAVGVLSTASATSPEDAGPIQAFCSIAPQKFIVEHVGGDAVSVGVLVGPGQSPHMFEPTPKQMAGLAEARVYFSIGLAFERELLERTVELNPDLVVVDMSSGIKRRRIEETHEDHHAEGDDGHDHGAPDPVHGHTYDHGHAHDVGDSHSDESGLPDPHVWLSPRNAVTMAETTHEALVRLLPERKPALDVNLDALRQYLLETHSELWNRLRPFAGARVYVFHPAFGYFTDAYGLVQVPIELGGMEPGARELAALIERARADEARVVFVQPQFSSNAATAIADEIGGVVVTIDPLSEDYIENLREIAGEMEEALSR